MPGGVASLVASPDGATLAITPHVAAGESATTTLMCAADGATVATVEGMARSVSPDSAILATQIQTATTTLWRTNDGGKIRLQEALEQARVVEIETTHAFHDVILGAKDQVIAQYGPDATAVQIIGLTRKSDHKRPTRRKATA